MLQQNFRTNVNMAINAPIAVATSTASNPQTVLTADPTFSHTFDVKHNPQAAVLYHGSNKRRTNHTFAASLNDWIHDLAQNVDESYRARNVQRFQGPSGDTLTADEVAVPVQTMVRQRVV